MLTLLIWDADLGIGTTKNVWLAQIDGLLILMEFVFQLLTNALQAIIMEIALHAIKDMTFLKDNVYSHYLTTPNLPIQDAEPGIGIIKCAYPALKVGSST